MQKTLNCGCSAPYILKDDKFLCSECELPTDVSITNPKQLGFDFSEEFKEITQDIGKICTCGSIKVFGPGSGHSSWCDWYK